MARLLLATHDPGGANMLAALVAPLRARGHDVILLPAGPAAAIWRRCGWEVAEQPADAVPDLSLWQPDLVITGTSALALYDCRLWAAARDLGIPSLAAIEAWTNLDARFRRAGIRIQPDWMAVPDEGCRADLVALGFAAARVVVGGQPHLEDMAGRLRRARAGRTADPRRAPVLAFFSEPIKEDYPDGRRGLDQYGVFRTAIRAMTALAPVRVALCLHPREPSDWWGAELDRLDPPRGIEVVVSEEGSFALAASCDGALGVTTMVLVEAVLAGVPVLSLQPGGAPTGNPLIARAGIPVCGQDEQFAPALAALLAQGVRPSVAHPWLTATISGSVLRLIAFVEKVLDVKS